MKILAPRFTIDEIIRARQELVELGILEDSGERQPDSCGAEQRS
jgi:hypothetical protein